MVTLCIDNRERYRIPAFESYIKSGKSKIVDKIELDNYFTDIHTPDLLVGIEYKKDDLIESIFSGLLDKQLKELSEQVQYPYLFIGYEGLGDTISNNVGTNPDVILGKIASIISRQKITVMFVSDFLVPFTIKVVERFYDDKTPVKISNYSPIRNKSKRAKPSNDEIKRHMVGDIPRVGHGKSQRLLEHYGNSLKSLGDAPLEELANLKIGKKRIGEKLAERIKEILK
jgi:ERCC4-type nuclease